MKTKTSVLLLLASLACLATHQSAAAVIPAGTDLIVETMQSVGVVDPPGTKFAVRLLQPVSAEGRAVLPAGTKLTARVATSRRLVSSSERLTVALSEVIIGNRAVPIKTAAVPMDSYTSARGVAVSSGAYQVPAGRKLRFRTSKPINV